MGENTGLIGLIAVEENQRGKAIGKSLSELPYYSLKTIKSQLLR